MIIQYALYAVVEEDERVLVVSLDNEPDPAKVEEIIIDFMGTKFNYEYALIEKQYHRESE